MRCSASSSGYWIGLSNNRLGFSLEEIRAMYDSETQRPSIDMLEENIRSCQEQLRLLTECRDRLLAMITLNQVLTEKVFSWRISNGLVRYAKVLSYNLFSDFKFWQI